MIVDVQKYNILRAALVNSPEEPHDTILVKPKAFALKKVHSADVLEAAKEILTDVRCAVGITPMQTLQSLALENEQPNMDNIPMEVIFYVLVSYAVAVQQGWIVYSLFKNCYHVNLQNKFAVEYMQDIHGIKIH